MTTYAQDSLHMTKSLVFDATVVIGLSAGPQASDLRRGSDSRPRSFAQARSPFSWLGCFDLRGSIQFAIKVSTDLTESPLAPQRLSALPCLRGRICFKTILVALHFCWRQ
jgi:hypothetical protein